MVLNLLVSTKLGSDEASHEVKKFSGQEIFS